MPVQSLFLDYREDGISKLLQSTRGHVLKAWIHQECYGNVRCCSVPLKISLNYRWKVTFFPVHFMKACRGCGGIATLIINLCTRSSLDPNQENSEYSIRRSVVLELFVNVSSLTVQNFLDIGRLTEWEVLIEALNYQTSWESAKWTRRKCDLKMSLGQIYVMLNMQYVKASTMSELKSQNIIF